MTMSTSQRPNAPQSSRSFSRLESPSSSPLNRSRANTIQGTATERSPTSEPLSVTDSDGHAQPDHFVTKEEDSGDELDEETNKAPETLEELPIEIRSLTERFLESLSAKVHPTPLSADALSDLFQDFYTRAESHISTHIAILSSRISRDVSPSPSISSRTSTGLKVGTRTPPLEKVAAEQQMLTSSEISGRKKARRLLETKRFTLQEAVERAVCEKVYDRIWRHRSTEDEERDHKLRSRTAALSLVGIGLKELLASADDVSEDVRKKTEDEEGHIRESLAGARESIQKMSQQRYPLGKLQNLTAAHKAIVETLSQVFPASSSADEILPTLIYALITSPPATLNVISDLKFIQRFRSSGKIDGEAAYCLVNLEAAISFLETVDLPSLRSDELPEGPDKDKAGSPASRRSNTLSSPMKLGIEPASDPLVSPATSDSTSARTNKPLPSPTTKQQRRLSHLISAQTSRIEQATDSFRDTVLDSADQAFDTLNSTLENSFKFVFGRFREEQVQKHGEDATHEVPLPKTLEDARKLVSSVPGSIDDADDAGSINTNSSAPEQPDDSAHADNRLLDMVAGRRASRDRSVDSAQSGGSGRRMAQQPTPPGTAPPANVAVESIRTIGSAINPLNRFGGMFGRSSPSTTPAVSTQASDKGKQLGEPAKEMPLPPPPMTPKAVRALAALEELRKTSPPIRRFMEAKEAKDLRIRDVDELLRDYQRLAMVLRQTLSP